ASSARDSNEASSSAMPGRTDNHHPRRLMVPCYCMDGGLARRAASCYLCGADGLLNRPPSALGRSGMAGILRTVARVANRHDQRRPGFRARPERIVPDARHGVAPSPKPPVRIFVGTEPAQYRAERIFVWSVEQARDPARVYEIYLMADLLGFDRRRWLTGF